MTPLSVLQAARQILDDKTRWTQRALAKTANKEPCLPSDYRAVCWCLLGATRVYPISSWLKYVTFGYLMEASLELYSTTPQDVNDALGYEAALKVCEYAVSLATRSREGKLSN